MKVLSIYIAIFLLPLTVAAQTKADSVIHIYFSMGNAMLDDYAKHTMDSLWESGFLQGAEGYTVTGYADVVGSKEANQELSQKRANNVTAYLHKLGVQDIDTVMASGEIDRPEKAGGYAEDRRVDITYGITPKPVPPIDISKLKVDETFELKGMYFHPGIATMQLSSRPVLASLYDLMYLTPKLKIQVEGHIHCNYKVLRDYRPDLPFEETLRKCGNKLATARAKVVHDYLLEKGIEQDRVKYVGLGCLGIQEHPYNNKRVEIRILEK